jgi:hypothetical protein
MSTLESNPVLYTDEEVDAALCLWEECLLRKVGARSKGGLEAMEAEPLWVWLSAGEGAASARDMCLQLAKDIELSYQYARLIGFDDSFDWEFVPRWADYAMEVTEEHFLDDKWNRFIAKKVTEDWHATFPT